MRVTRLDHVVLTVADIDATVDFYRRVLGAEPIVSPDGRTAVRLGEQQLNLHRLGKEFEPKAARPTPGSTDLCVLVDADMDEILRRLAATSVEIEVGPVGRTGAHGPLRSVYVRDPDRNLLEIAVRDA
jgi:catechol 2,3-dioxygenase-like lactoylglutathione lyase family enzyme